MQETLLDFDAVDASGDQGAVTPLNLKTSEKKLAFYRNVRYDAGTVDAES